MNIYIKFLKLLLVLAVGIFFLVGSGGGKKKTDSPPQDESNSSGNNQNSDTSSEYESSSNQGNDFPDIYADRTENYTINAETLLRKELKLPFNRVSLDITKEPQHAYRTNVYTNKSPEWLYLPNYGYIGKDSFEITATNLDDDNTITIKITIDIIKPSLEGYRDYTISYNCNKNKLGNAKNFDIGFYTNDLTLIDKLYDDHNIGSNSFYRIIPRQTMHSYNSPYSLLMDYYENLNNPPKNLKKHDSMFKKYSNDLMQLTCNYPNGYLNLIYPVDNKNWYATKPSPYGDTDIIYSRNDLYFFVSYLSELYSQVYLKSYLKTGDRDESFINAKLFMEKIFPNGHYTAELLHNFNRETKKWDKTDYADKFDKENKVYYDLITTLADELTNGNIPKVISKIADNYESYYLSSNKTCLDKTICGTLFPEYTKLVTKNNDFSNGLEYWVKNEKLVEPATGKIEYLPTNNTVTIEYTSNRDDGTDADSSSLDLYQIEQLNGATIDDYFFKFDMNQIYGGADGGFPARLGLNSSGFAGVYICFDTSSNESLGCIAWSDHLNKFDLAWGPAKHHIKSSETFYNIRQDNVIRRVKPSAKNISYKVDLSNYLKRNLPEVYKRKNEITSLEYGMFTTEFRSQNNGCYFCEAKMNANDISLFKIK